MIYILLILSLILAQNANAKVSFEWQRVSFESQESKNRYNVPVRRSDPAMWELNGVVYLFGGYINDFGTSFTLDDFWKLENVESAEPTWTLVRDLILLI